MSAMRGLNMFIADLRNSKTKEDENKRVLKELANIREKFSSTKKALTGYDRRKYVWKMVYMHMMGYEIEFGHIEVIHLITSSKFSEKVVGYIATSILMKNTDDLMTLIVNSIRNDLMQSRNNVSQSLALAATANLGGMELAETLCVDIQRILVKDRVKNVVIKKSALCLVRLYRANPDLMNTDRDFIVKAIRLLDLKHLGVLCSVMSLMIQIVSHSIAGCEDVLPRAILLLTRLVMHKACSSDYIYYQTPSPWLTVKLMKVLQYFPLPEDPTLKGRIIEILTKVMTTTKVTKSLNKNNADHSILFESVNLVIHYGASLEESLTIKAVDLLARFISVREPNIRYLGLDTMAKLADSNLYRGLIKKHETAILFSLKEADVSIRKRALHLMFSMCDTENAVDIVRELLNNLITADITIKEEMVLKIAILAERFAPDYQWYVDTVLQLIRIAGDYVSDDIWHRTVQIISQNDGLQAYAAYTLYEALKSKGVHEMTVKIASYVLGEYGELLIDYEDNTVSGSEQYGALKNLWDISNVSTKSIMLHTFVKMHNLYEDIQDDVVEMLESNETNASPELQQRAVEYNALIEQEEIVDKILAPMPAFPEDRESALVERLRRKETGKGKNEDEDDAGSDDSDSDDSDSDDEENENDESEEESEEEEEEDSAPAASDDLLGLMSSIPTTTTTTTPLPPATTTTTAAMPSGPPRGIDPALVGSMKQWYRQLVVTPKGKLYEDSIVQIGVQHEYKGNKGLIKLFFGNKTSSPITSLKSNVPTTAETMAMVEPIDSTIGSNSQVRQQIKLECMQPFQSPPVLQVSFVCAGIGYALPLRLPAVLLSFCDPISMPGSDFMGRWSGIGAGEKEKQTSFKSGRPVDITMTRDFLSNKLKLAVVEGVDPNPNNFCCAGTFKTGSKTADGHSINVGFLLRLECNPTAQAYRLTIRANHRVVASSLSTVISNQLSA